MASTAERIKDRLGIVDVVSSYIKVEQAGGNFKARCPFHNEKTPSFFISPGRNTYYCFGCGAKGDIFSFVQEYEKMDFLGALKVLAERAGVPLDEFKSESYKKSEKYHALLDAATSYYEKQLSTNTKALEYLKSRGLTDQSIREWRIGFAPDEWRSVSEYLLRQNQGKHHGEAIDLEDLEMVGLIKRNEDKSYDRFRSRIMFPLFDSSGRVAGFSGRIFGKDESESGPKYLNSPDSQVFNKSELLYGFDRAKHSAREWGYVILVEGQMDLLMSHQVGVKNAVATSGTALTSEHLEKIGRMTKNLVFMYDADNAGYGATRRGERLAIEQGFDVKVVTLPNGEDPASLIQKDKQAFIQALKKSTHVVEYYLNVLTQKYPNEHDLIKAIEKEIVPDIALTPSAIRRGELISLVATRGLKSKIHEKQITEEVERVVKKIEQEGRETVIGSGSGSSQNSGQQSGSNISSHSNAVGSVVQTPGMVRMKSRPSIDVSLRRTVALMAYLDDLIAKGNTKYQKTKELAEAQFNTCIDEQDALIVSEMRTGNLSELLFEAEAFFAHSDKLEDHMFELLNELEERFLKEKLNKYMSELSLAEGAKNKVKSDEIIKKCQEISLRLSELHRQKKT